MHLSSIKQMEHLARGRKDVISLSQGIPFADSDVIIREFVRDAIWENSVDRYSDPQGIARLRERISERLKNENMNYSPDEILVTNGAVEAMMSSVLALTSPGDEVVVLTPTYAAFFRACEIARLNVISVPLVENTGWKIDLEHLKNSISNKTRAIILCNPNNPTGTVYKKEELQDIAAIAQQNNFFLILDEVYSRMLYTDAPFYTPASEEKYKEHIIRIESFSKTYSLTGWRIGFLHSHKRKIEKILPVHDSLVNCAPVVSQYAAIAALSLPDAILQKKLDTYKKHRTIMSMYLKQIESHISFYEPEGAYFFFPKLRDVHDSKRFSFAVLEKAKVAIVPGEDFGPGGEGHFRLCFGRREKDIIQGMERIIDYFQQR